jgi:hypothetical protein
MRTSDGTKIQLLLLECLLYLTETRDLTETDIVKSPVGAINYEDRAYDYPYQLQKNGIFRDVLNIFLSSSGKHLGEMDDIIDDNYYSETDTDDESPKIRGIPHLDYSQRHSVKSLKEKIASISLKLLRTTFAEEFSQDIQKSQLDQAMCHAMNGMDFGPSSNITDLVSSFGNLKHQRN